MADAEGDEIRQYVRISRPCPEAREVPSGYPLLHGVGKAFETRKRQFLSIISTISTISISKSISTISIISRTRTLAIFDVFWLLTCFRLVHLAFITRDLELDFHTIGANLRVL